MKREELKKQVKKLRNELEEIKDIKIRQDVEKLLDQVDSDLQISEKSDLTDFELHYPKMVALINKVSDMLASIGI